MIGRDEPAPWLAPLRMAEAHGSGRIADELLRRGVVAIVVACLGRDADALPAEMLPGILVASMSAAVADRATFGRDVARWRKALEDWTAARRARGIPKETLRRVPQAERDLRARTVLALLASWEAARR